MNSKGSTFAILIFVAALFLLVGVACSSARPTPASVAPQQPAPAVAPTVAAQPTVTAITGVSTPTPVAPTPTPTRVLPTATPATTTGPQYGGTLRIGVGSTGGGNEFFITMLPNYGNSYQSRVVFTAVFDTLLRTAPDLSLKPGLASSWDISSNGEDITFHLQKGVKFQDGSPFNASVVKWNMDLNLHPDTAPVLDPVFSGVTPQLDMRPFVTGVDVVDDNTIVFHLNKPFRPLLAWLADRVSFQMLSPQAAQNHPGQLGKLPIGTGPFKFVSWNINEDLKVTKNDNYWEQGKPYLDGIDYLMVNEPQVHVAMLRTGEEDLASILPDYLNQVNDNSRLKVTPYNSQTMEALQERVTVSPWNNKLVRQAMAYAINRDDYIKSAYGGYGHPIYTSEGDTLWWSAPDLKPFTYDPQKAKQILAQAGYPNGLTVSMGCQANAATELRKCEIIQSMLGAVGIKVNLNLTPTIFLDMMEGKIDFRIAPGWAVYGDPDTRLRFAFYTTGGYHALTDYSNPEADKILDEAAGVYDHTQAAQLYRQFMQIVTEDAAWIPIMDYEDFAAMQSNVMGVVWYPDEVFRVGDIWFSK